MAAATKQCTATMSEAVYDLVRYLGTVDQYPNQHYRRYANDCNTLLNEILAEVQDIVQHANSINFWNSPTTLDVASIKQNVIVREVMDTYDNEDSMVEESESEPIEPYLSISKEA